MRALLLIVCVLAGPILSGAQASVVRPCREPLAGAERLGDARWVGHCAASRGMTARACRRWLAACRSNPQHPLPAGTNNL
ncbi:MAG TPA: hypothetical protein VHA55_15095 [Pseudorhodoplanes sp.]|jgi:hypothetical protein|nr:hypothetical protein [Pseudorhodoplanes sp.]